MGLAAFTSLKFYYISSLRLVYNLNMQKSLVGKLEIGTRVVLTNEKFNGVKATVKYVGPLDSTIEWIGVELDEEKGSHSG